MKIFKELINEWFQPARLIWQKSPKKAPGKTGKHEVQSRPDPSIVSAHKQLMQTMKLDKNDGRRMLNELVMSHLLEQKAKHFSPELLDELAGYPSAIIRIAVAKNYHTGRKTLKKLAKDKDPSVRLAIVEHNDSAAAESVMYILVGDSDPKVRGYAMARTGM